MSADEPQWNPDDARRLHEAGYHLFPIGDNKKPKGRWRRGEVDHVMVRASDPKFRGWLGTKPPGWCVITGGPKRTAVIDVEDAGMADTSEKGDRIREVIARYPDTCKRPTPSGGLHVWLQVTDDDAPAGGTIETCCRVLNGTKISAAGHVIKDTTLLVELRAHGQYAGMLGFGRGDLPEDWAPHPVTRAELDETTAYLNEVSDIKRTVVIKKRITEKAADAPVRAKNEAARNWKLQPPVDTADVLAGAMAFGYLSWLDVLDPGWEEAGATGDGWTLWRRPDYDGTGVTSVSSANGRELVGIASLTVHSTSVPWSDGDQSYSPAEVLARARYGGDFGRAMRVVETAARQHKERRLPPDSPFAAWEPRVLASITALVEVRRAGREALMMGNAADLKDSLVTQVGAGRLAGLFTRGGHMSHVPTIGEQGYTPPPPEAGEDGPAQVWEVSAQLLNHLFESEYYLYKTVVTKEGDEMDQHMMMPAGVAERLVSAAHLMPNLRTLGGVVHTPLLRPDGTMLATAGYDDATRLLYLPEVPCKVPEKPTAEAVEAALAVVESVIGDFPWKHPGDKANYVAALVLPFLRLIVPPPWPMWMLNAHQPGSGKTMLSKILRHTHGGVQRTALPRDEDEIRKQLTSLLMTTGGQVIIWDNVMGLIKSAELANILTARTRTDRKLGESKDVTVTNDRLFAMTGNNLMVGGDLPRRVVWVTIDPGMPHPELRSASEFRLPDPDLWVRDNLGAFREALLTVVAAWVAEGMAIGVKTRTDDYGRLGAVMAGVLPYFKVAGFMHDDTVVSETAVDDEDWANFFRALHVRYGDKSFTAAEVLMSTALFGEYPDDLQKRQQFGTLTARSLGSFFRNRVGRYHGGFRLDGQHDRDHTMQWRITSSTAGTAGSAGTNTPNLKEKNRDGVVPLQGATGATPSSTHASAVEVAVPAKPALPAPEPVATPVPRPRPPVVSVQKESA